MKSIYAFLAICFVLLFSATLAECKDIFVFSAAPSKFRNINYKKQTDRLIKAIQEDNFDEIFKLNSVCQGHVLDLKQEIPKYRLKKQLEDYYEQVYNQYKSGEFLKKGLFPKSCKWKILEISSKDAHHAIEYVAVSYKSEDESFHKDEFSILKDTVVQIEFYDGFYEGFDFSEEETDYWDMPFKIYNLKYKYNIDSLLCEFGVYCGKKDNRPKAIPPYKYNIYVNDQPIEEYLKRYERNNKKLHKSFDYFYFGQPDSFEPQSNSYFYINLNNHENEFYEYWTKYNKDNFVWPSDTSFPVTIKIIVQDNSNPPQKAAAEIQIKEGLKFDKPISQCRNRDEIESQEMQKIMEQQHKQKVNKWTK